MTDAIVVFGTNDQELYAGTQLLKLGYAPLVFVTSDKPKTAFFHFFKTFNLAPEQFIFDRELAVNTSNYSTDTAEFLRKYRLQSSPAEYQNNTVQTAFHQYKPGPVLIKK